MAESRCQGQGLLCEHEHNHEHQDFSSSWDIRATPMFFLKNGQQIGKLVGANKRELEKESASSR